ncbi:hypothetical protein [Sphingomonas sp. PAMC26645]|uniref:hypothetical protein n=1 Tax=Sphingomonas sp. PAMC26645 TaxID=2565555 RepID=UPI001444D70D|nr:hypothetical protein [Sphingomonas sp. PAMC26645]
MSSLNTKDFCHVAFSYSILACNLAYAVPSHAGLTDDKMISSSRNVSIVPFFETASIGMVRIPHPKDDIGLSLGTVYQQPGERSNGGEGSSAEHVLPRRQLFDQKRAEVHRTSVGSACAFDSNAEERAYPCVPDSEQDSTASGIDSRRPDRQATHRLPVGRTPHEQGSESAKHTDTGQGQAADHRDYPRDRVHVGLLVLVVLLIFLNVLTATLSGLYWGRRALIAAIVADVVIIAWGLHVIQLISA